MGFIIIEVEKAFEKYELMKLSDFEWTVYYDKVFKMIDSCNTLEQLANCHQFALLAQISQRHKNNVLKSIEISKFYLTKSKLIAVNNTISKWKK